MSTPKKFEPNGLRPSTNDAHRPTLARLVAVVGAIASAGSAYAAQPAVAAKPDDTQLQEVTVTGSRLITNGNDSPNPITVVTVEEIQATRPTTVFEGLLDMPQVTGSSSVTSNPNAAGATNANISALSLRGLGPQRTLVLNDGHRVPPTQQDGFVDANLIPQMLLQRVDIVSGGVSAVYGSEGITGVVNYITDRKFNGVKANLRYGQAEHGDDRSSEIGIATGQDIFGGRGHIEGSYGRHDDGGIARRTDRPFGLLRWGELGNSTAASPLTLYPYEALANTTFGGKVINGPLANQQFLAGGTLAPFTNGLATGNGNVQSGGDGAYNNGTSLKGKLNFNQVFGRFDFDLTDAVHYNLSGSAVIEHTIATGGNNRPQGQGVANQGTTLSTSNAYLTPAQQAAFKGATAISTFILSKLWDANTVPPSQGDGYTRQWWVNTGFDGKLGSYHWDVSYTHSLAKMDNRSNASIDNGRMYAALDAVTNSAGQIVCQVSTTANASLYPGCVPMNIFGPNSESAASIDYILRRAEIQTKTTMDDVSGTFTGAPFNDWAGPINMAVSGEWRKLGYSLTSNSLPAANDPLDCTGLRFNCVANGTAKYSSATLYRPAVSQTISEAAYEVDVPLLKDLPFARKVDFNAAYRYAHYANTGQSVYTQPATTRTFSASIWKVGLDWHFSDAVTLRGTRSRDFRAPTLVDLYAPTTQGTANFTDFLTTYNGPVIQQGGGNPNLSPEISYTSTVGMVFQPGGGKFSLAVDGYDITVRNAIANAFAGNAAAQSACLTSGGTSFFCQLFERPLPYTNTTLANAPTKIYNGVPFNYAEFHTYGVDTEANYRTELASHPLSLRGLVSYQPHSLVVSPGSILENAGVDYPEANQTTPVVRASVFAHYSLTDKFSVDWLTKYRSRLHRNTDPNAVVAQSSKWIPSIAYSNLTLNYQFTVRSVGNTSAFFNVQNLFNQQPYPSNSTGASTVPGQAGGFVPGDDVTGRYYSIGLRLKL